MSFKKSYPIVGMHCSSCAKLIERKLSKVSGVTSATVNYGNETAYIEGKFDDNEIQKSVESFGYKIGKNIEEEKNKELKKLKIKVFISLSAAVLIMVLSFFKIVNFTFYILPLAILIQLVIGFEFYQALWSDIRNLSFGMNSLVAIGTTAAIFGGYYETSVMIIALILLGRFLETNAKNRSSDAIKTLVGLQKELDQNLLVGDVVTVKPGQKIATDGIITEGESYIDESMITGESVPAKKGKGDKVTGGTINGNGSFSFKVTKVGSETVLSQIIKMVSEAQGSRAEIQDLVDKVSSYFTPIVFGVALITFFAFGLTNAIAVLVIACPCAMGLATPTAIIVAVGRGASIGILIKDVQALEILNKIKTIVFDKTGTLTKGNFGVVEINTNTTNNSIITNVQLLQFAASVEQYSEHPIAMAIMTNAKKINAKLFKVTKFKAIEGVGVEGFIDGVKVEVKRPGVSVYKDGELIGSIVVEDEIKSGVKETIDKLSSKGITAWMITGDNKIKAAKIANEAGIKNVLSEVMPADKANKIKELGIGSQVAFVGDGINDAPALATASVGIAMGTGTDIAIESAGITLMNKDFRSILSIFNLSKYTMNIIKQNLFWAFGYNIILIPVAAFGLLNPMIAAGAMAISSLSVVGNSLRLKTVKI